MQEGLSRRLRAKVPVVGTFARIPSPDLVEILAHAGFDFVIIDTEHTAFGMETVIDMVRAADASGIAPLVRVAENDAGLIAKALDMGSQGVVVPRVGCKEDAVRAVKAARFHPLGERGACSRVRAGNYSSMDATEYFSRANERTILVLLVETAEGAANLADIVSVPGVDVILLGASDLSQSLGVPGQNDHPLVRQMLSDMVGAVRGAGLVVGRVAFSAEEARSHLKHGTTFQVYSGDETLFYAACRDAVRVVREAIPV